MNDRELILDILRRLMERYPSQRVGQIIENANGEASRGVEGLFYTADADLERRLRSYLSDSYIR